MSFELLSHRAVGLRFVARQMAEQSWTEHCHDVPSRRAEPGCIKLCRSIPWRTELSRSCSSPPEPN